MSITFRPGRLPNDPAKPRLALSLDAVNAPASVDWLQTVQSWPMYLNDQIGDCTEAANGHFIQLVTANAGMQVTIADAEVLAAYERVSGYNPATGANDNGAVIQDELRDFAKTGIGGHKILAFAQIKHGDPVQVRAAIAAFGAVILGVNLPRSAEDQFNNGRQPWTVVPGSPILGGHCIIAGAYDAASYGAVTWGDVVVIDQPWWSAYVEEAWVVITQDWIEKNGQTPAGMAVSALGAEYTQLTGKPSPFPPTPVPTPPTPTPVPVPVPTDPAQAFLAAVPDGWDTRHHVGDNEKVAKAVQALRKALG